jgi:hypothetical protein
VSGESQSIRRLHISDPLRVDGAWLPHCMGCGWRGEVSSRDHDAADAAGRWHARRETLAQIRLERGGGSGGDDAA